MPSLSANTGVPEVFSGARARFNLGGQQIGYAGGVSGEETIQYEEVDVLDLLEVKEHVPVAYRCTLNAQIFRIIGKSLKAIGVFPTMSQIVTSVGMSATVENATKTPNQQQSIAQEFVGVRTSGHSFDITARGLVSENVNFVAIRTSDESEI